MYKKFLVFGSVLLVLSFVVFPAFAETGVTSTAAITTTAITKAEKNAAKVADVAAKIACVKTAIATREAAFATAVATHSQAVQAAYSTRANELAGAYSNTTIKTLQAGVKVSWIDFNKSIKSATKAWNVNRDVAWSVFRALVKTCNAPVGVTDGGNSSSEIKGL